MFASTNHRWCSLAQFGLAAVCLVSALLVGAPSRQVQAQVGTASPNALWTAPGIPSPAGIVPQSTVRVINARQLNIRQSPGYRFKGPTDVRGTVGRSAVLTVDWGPTFADGLTWWHVQVGWINGWAAEQSASGLPLLRPIGFGLREYADPYLLTLYVVRPGDTLTNISNQFQTSVAEIMQRNQLPDVKIKAYQTLLVPAPDLTWPLDSIVGIVGGMQPGADGSGVLTLTQSEGNLRSVALNTDTYVAYGTGTSATMWDCAPGQTVEVIGRYGPDAVVRAQEIYIVAGPRAAMSLPPSMRPPRLYAVQPGDTLYSIAARWQTTVPAIQQANGLDLTQGNVNPGQVLRIP